MLKTQVLYVSTTGNTEKIAEMIYLAVPGSAKDIKKLDSCFDKCSADTYFIGFWANRGSASMEILDYLSNLHGKNIGLFCTCGMGNHPEYFKKIEHNVTAFIPDDNRYLGAFFCQGKMPFRIRQKYEAMETLANSEQIRNSIKNFDDALLHPDQEDCRSASDFTASVMEELKHLRKQETKL